MSSVRIGLLLLVVAACGGSMVDEPGTMSAADALAMPRPKPDHRLEYGDDPLQFGELRLPEGEGPYPIVIVIHGGCWLAEYDLGHISSFAEALTRAGVATWSIEYRRVGNDGGGWPGTFQDVANAADYVLEMALAYDLDIRRVAAIGHSAGGHLALWLAGRNKLEADDPFRGHRPLALNGVVSLAGIPDLAGYASPEGCGAAVPRLLGGDPAEMGDRLRRASPIAMLPLGVRQTLVIGEVDSIVPASQARDYVRAARQMRDPVELTTIPDAGHFELIDPSCRSFRVVRAHVLEALEPTSIE